ncbi:MULTISPECIES: DUF2510 domain-containing protein [unclassified Leifsonia]|uniref:DUF2510 domain-containing protein n=1 Tax=unclassified Leifsonia TaxID=2663824 RepID=UPI0006FC8C69|nr:MULTISPECIES: DUF2510 domain-containing protein [unclassified Leifsonia]KQX07825.1 hypothetical protein ASC59_08895 [Leifsonia sp. Root1293]KRA12106.1 hypothetical protein ASD61_08895 [Leifsonia sp. Root60]
MSTAPPGWYADPGAAHDPSVPADSTRWWDGTAWTEHTHVPASVTDETGGSGERNPFSRYALILGIATIAAAAAVAVTPLAGLVAVITGLLALLLGILGIVRSMRTRTGRTASIWGTVLGPAGVILAGIVWIVTSIAMTPNLGLPGFDYPQPVSETAERRIMRDLERAAASDPSVPAPESVQCPDDIGYDDVQFLCTIEYPDGSSNVAFVTQTASGLYWQPSELGEEGE